MKNLIFPSFVLLLALVFTGCEDKHTESYVINKPILKTYGEWRSEEISMQAAQTPAATGKIYSYKQYLLVNEPLKGVHFFDNSDPSAPVNLGFLPIHANVDMAVRNNLLYVNAYTDLLTFDISNIAAPQMVCRVEDAFNFTAVHQLSGYDPELPMEYYQQGQGVVIGWKQEKVTNEIETQLYYPDQGGFTGPMMPSLSNSPRAGTNVSVGVGGSMAMFTIADDYLYTLQPNRLSSYHLQGQCPDHQDDVNVFREAETIFQAQGHLFIGTTTGMLIYSIGNPASPSLVSDYPHLNACDPVVVQDDRAYVTLRTGNACQGNVNELLVLDVSNLSQPQLIKSYSMTNPHGLGIDGNTLFVCDGSDGLKAFDSRDDLNILQNRIGHFADITAYDIIPLGGVLLTSATEGIYQYDYSDPSDIKLLSKIEVK